MFRTNKKIFKFKLSTETSNYKINIKQNKTKNNLLEKFVTK